MRRTRHLFIVLAAVLAALAVLGMAGCGSSAAGTAADPAGLANVRLGPDYSHWLLGPIARMATPEEIDAYRALDDDFAALELIDAFWTRRGADARRAFESRVQAADRRYGEGGVLGRRTPRGTIHVLYGAPESIEYEIPLEGGEPIEVWEYPEDAPVGLDGRAPDRFYRFRKQGELTVPYQPGGRRNTLPALRG
jgi:GWxTD domain-containing protein